MFDPQAWAALSHLTSEQVVRLAEALPSMMAAGAALSTSITSLVVAIKARQAASAAQRTAEDATDQAREAAKEQIRFALKDVVRHVNSEGIGRGMYEACPAVPMNREPSASSFPSSSPSSVSMPPEEGGAS